MVQGQMRAKIFVASEGNLGSLLKEPCTLNHWETFRCLHLWERPVSEQAIVL